MSVPDADTGLSISRTGVDPNGDLAPPGEHHAPRPPRTDPRLYALKPEFDRVLKDLETPEARARAEALHRRLSRVNPEDGFRPFDI
jgi:hypothetical protein